ncbi:MAG: endopeptidase La [Myxococcales bacterium]|nr:endopeptidase La [Myxococcales bacterium]
MVPLRNTVVFPGLAVPIAVGRKSTLAAIERAREGDGRIFAVAQRENVNRPTREQLHEVGVVARVSHVEASSGTVNLVLQADSRAKALEYRFAEGKNDPIEVDCLPLEDAPPPDPDDPAYRALEGELQLRAAELGGKRGVPKQVLERVMDAVTSPGLFADLVMGHLDIPVEDKQAVLENLEVEDRMRQVLVHVQRLLNEHEAREDIQSKVQEELGERQRELFLREQMKAIQKELGGGDGDDELAALRKRLEALQLPEEARNEVERELARLERTARESAEAQVIRTYLETVAELPWSTRTEDRLDVSRAADVLDADHYGLSDVKDRVLEFLAVRQLHDEVARQRAAADAEAKDEDAEEGASAKGPILLFIGPPGVGKTSIGKSIARALDRKYVRLALGGVRDEADIRGHRRTYVGAMPGRIVQALKQAGTRNPVILLDEVDKLGVSYQGNPAAALLEVLDPAQNHSFTDHYIGVPFDLSEVLFVATANFIEGIPAPLLDRMELVEFAGYTEREKREIAKTYLIPRQLEEAGIAGRGLELTDDAVSVIVSRYTREAGVRQLERRIGAVARKLARRLAADEQVEHVVTPALVRELLGRPKVRPEKVGEQDEVGVGTGMYYTPAGGDIMFVEASIRRLSDFRNADTSMQVQGWGNVSLILTGQLGDVMKESARAALTYAATRAPSLGIAPERIGSIEAHIHVPAGAVPKDGPSAGVAMATALVSAMTDRPVRRDVAMTGEITLRGRVLPIGGVKEKVLGAHRAGIKHIILPEENGPDLDDLPAEVVGELEVTLVSSLDQVLAVALVEPGTEPGDAPEVTPPAELH